MYLNSLAFNSQTSEASLILSTGIEPSRVKLLLYLFLISCQVIGQDSVREYEAVANRQYHNPESLGYNAMQTSSLAIN